MSITLFLSRFLSLLLSLSLSLFHFLSLSISLSFSFSLSLQLTFFLSMKRGKKLYQRRHIEIHLKYNFKIIKRSHLQIYLSTISLRIIKYLLQMTQPTPSSWCKNIIPRLPDSRNTRSNTIIEVFFGWRSKRR